MNCDITDFMPVQMYMNVSAAKGDHLIRKRHCENYFCAKFMPSVPAPQRVGGAYQVRQCNHAIIVCGRPSCKHSSTHFSGCRFIPHLLEQYRTQGT